MRIFLKPLSTRFAFHFCAALIAVVLLSSIPLVAKEKKKETKRAAYALIKGGVFREDGFSIRGARVTCRRTTDKKPKWETISVDGGDFGFRLPAGKMQYIVTAEMNGFEPASKPVEILNDERQDISLVLKSKTP